MHRKKINISTVLAGQRLGIREVDEAIWLASFIDYDLGYIDLEQRTLQPTDTPSAQGCHPCLKYVLLPMSPGWTPLSLGDPGRIRTCDLQLRRLPLSSTELRGRRSTFEQFS
jgi:hypothetical protein